MSRSTIQDMLWRQKARAKMEMAPEDIFLDVSNASALDRARFEGRMEKPLSPTTYYALTAVLALLFIVIAARTAHLEIVEGNAYAAQSANNSLEAAVLFAPRGAIVDRRGVVLAQNTAREDGTMRRTYTLPEIGQIIGYVSFPKKDANGVYYQTTEIGQAGLEAAFNGLLGGKNGQILTEKNAVGEVRSQGVLVKAVEGATLTLTLDAELTRLLAHAIRDTAKRTGFIAGAGVIMDVHTGEVHAMVSHPSFDSNVMSSGGPPETIAAYSNDLGRPYLDHAIQGVYAPGSIVKPIVAAGALHDGIITPDTIINDPGSMTIQNPYDPSKPFVFKGWKPLGLMHVRSAIGWSSDIFFYTVGGGNNPNQKEQKGLGIERLAYWYQQFGIGTTTGIGVPGEAAGLVPTPAWKEKTLGEPWYLGDTYFTAIGQYSMQVTPLQMARAIAAIANGGRLYTPLLRVGEAPTYSEIPIGEEALRVAREGMRYTVTSALAQVINVPYVQAAAKTGTAQTGTRNQYDNSWFVGFWPYDNPKYAFAVVLERGPEGSGSQAVNVMRDLFQSLKEAGSPYVNIATP